MRYPEIPEVEIKIDSFAITSTTRKLRTHWSTEPFYKTHPRIIKSLRKAGIRIEYKK